MPPCLSLLRTVRSHRGLEFIVQRNGEAEALGGGLPAGGRACRRSRVPPRRVEGHGEGVAPMCS